MTSTTAAIETTKPARVTLWTINDAILALVDRFEDESQTELTPKEIAAELAQLEDALEAKVEGCIAYLRSQETLAAGLKEESQRLNARANVHTNRAKRMKAALLFVLDAQKRPSVETKRGTVRAQQNGGVAPMVTIPLTTEVLDHLRAGGLADRYVITRHEWNNEALRLAHEAKHPVVVLVNEEPVLVATVGERGRHVVIK